MTHSDRLFQEARDRVKVEALAGVKLARLGFRLRGQCPVCKAGKGKLKDGPFWVDPGKQTWGCFAGQGDCERGGDAVRLEQLLHGGSPREAAERILGPGYQAAAEAEIVGPSARAAARDPGGESDAKAASAARLWREGRRVSAGSLVDLYLAARGLDEAVRAVMRAELRFHPEAFWGVVEDPSRLPPGANTIRLRSGEAGLLLPAMLAAPETPEGRTGGVHATYLKRDGSGKARLSPAKRMLGPQQGHGRPGGAWLSPRGGDFAGRPLIVGEGLETVGSAATLHVRRTGEVPRMAAALSLGAFSGGWLADAKGRYDVDQPEADPGRPAFTWPDAGEVWLAVDRDMSPVEVTVRGPGGRRRKRRLEADDRARVSGSLAVQAWTCAGAVSARVIAPGAGRDFNDELREGAG